VHAFFVGLHQPSDARHFDRAFISVNRLRERRADFAVGEWIMDSGAFSTIAQHGGFPHPVDEYAALIERWQSCGRMLAAVAQDYMCEPEALARTGLSVAEHQRLTIARYDDLLPLVHGAYLMPVLQGYQPADYVAHLHAYGPRLAPGAWVGVGSVCKRNATIEAIEEVLRTIRRARPDLQLHGFGLKGTCFASALVTDLLHTADSMAWSDAARKEQRRLVKRLQAQAGQELTNAQARAMALASGERWPDQNNWRTAAAWVARMFADLQQQHPMDLWC
jgi:hypothetical protein